MSDKCEKFNEKRKIFFVVLFFVSIAYLIYSFRGNFELPFHLSRQWNCPYIYNKSEEFSVVVDNQLNRLTFLDKSKKVYKTINYSSKTVISHAEDVVIYGDNVYVLGYIYVDSSLSPISSKILQYNKNGKFIKTIYEYSFLENEKVYGEIADIVKGKDCLYAIEIDNLVKLKLIKISLEDNTNQIIWSHQYNKAIYSGYYNENNQVISVVDYLGGFTSNEIFSDREYNYKLANGNVCSSIIVLDDYTGVYVNSRDMKICYGDEAECLVDNILTFTLTLGNNQLCFCDYNGNGICSYDFESKKITNDKKVYFSAGYFAKMVVNLFAIIYVLIFVACRIFIKIRGMLRNGEYIELKEIRFWIIIALLIIFIPMYYSYKVYSAQLEAIGERVKYTARVSSSMCQKSYKKYLIDYITHCNDIEKNYELIYLDYVRIYYFFNSFLTDNVNENKLDYFRFYVKSNGKYILAFGTNGEYQLNLPVEIVVNVEFGKDVSIDNFLKSEKSKNQRGSYYCAREKISDDNGSELAIVEYGMDYSYLKKIAVKRCIDYAMGLMVLIAIIYIVIKEISVFISTQIKGYKLKKQNQTIGESLYTRQYSFFVFFISSIDIIVAVLLLRDMCVQKNISEQSVAIILSCFPFVLYFSSTIGSILYTVFLPKLSVRAFNTFACIGMFIGVLGEFLGVMMINIPLFFIGRILFFIMQTNVYILCSSIADSAETEIDRYECHKESTRASISAGVLSGLVGGYVAQYISNKSVYVVAAIISVIILLIGLFILPRNKKYGVAKADKTTDAQNVSLSRKHLIKYIFTPRVLLYAMLLALPVAIFKNYKSVLFPLFSADFDLPKIYITNLYIIARTFNMIINSQTDKLTNEKNYRKGASACIMITGLCFLCFMINNTILWAVVMIIVTDFCVKIVNPMNKMIVSKDAELSGLNRDKVKGILEILVSLFSCLQTPLMAFFLTFGTDMACVFVGFFCGACGLIYALFSSVQKKKDEIQRC